MGIGIIENDRLTRLRLAGEADPPPDGAPAALDAGGTGLAGPPPPNSHTAQLADLVRAIREGGTPLVDGLAGRRPVDVILAIYELARSGREVQVR